MYNIAEWFLVGLTKKKSLEKRGTYASSLRTAVRWVDISQVGQIPAPLDSSTEERPDTAPYQTYAVRLVSLSPRLHFSELLRSTAAKLPRALACLHHPPLPPSLLPSPAQKASLVGLPHVCAVHVFSLLPWRVCVPFFFRRQHEAMQEMLRMHGGGGDGDDGGVFGTPTPPPPLPQASPAAAAAEATEALSTEEQVNRGYPLSLPGTTPSASGEEADVPANFVHQSHLAPPRAQATAAIENVAMVMTAETPPVGSTELAHAMPGVGQGQARQQEYQQEYQQQGYQQQGYQQQGYQQGYQQGHQGQNYSAGPGPEIDGAVQVAPALPPVYAPHTATGGQKVPRPPGLEPEPQLASAAAAAAPSFGHSVSSSNRDARMIQGEQAQEQQQQPVMVSTELSSRYAPGPTGVRDEVVKPSPLLWQGDAAVPPPLPPPPPLPSPAAARVPLPPPSPSELPSASPAVAIPPQDGGYPTEAGHAPPQTIKVCSYMDDMTSIREFMSLWKMDG